MNKYKRLDSIKSGRVVKVVHNHTRGKLKQKLLDMGFIPGSEIKVVREAPLYDPMEVTLFNYSVSLRKSEAYLLEVEEQ